MVRMLGDYEILETLGQGVQGKVKKARNKDGRCVALKFIKKSKINAKQIQNLRREVAAMGSCAHKNIVALNAVDWNCMYPKNDGSKEPCVMLDIEMAEGGELFNFLMYTGQFPENIARTYFRQLIAGLEHCHQAGISHRDLKAENLLLDTQFKLKIADFGLSAKHKVPDIERKPIWLETECGTQGYMAPEIFEAIAYRGPNADIWSAGVVLFIMMTGFPPFQMAKKGDWWFDRISLNQYSHFWGAHLRNADLSKGAQDLMTKIFVANPEERATIEVIKADPWFNGPQLTDAEVKAELRRRKAVVEEARAQEKERRQRERQRQTIESHTMEAEFDCESMAVYRGFSKDIEAPELPPEGVSHFTSFKVSDVPVTQIINRLEQALAKINAKFVVKSKKFKVKATVDTTAGAIGASAQVFKVAEDCHVVELRRRSGNTLKFQQFYNSICNELADIITADKVSVAVEVAAATSE
jgi:serine/threonine protein kinase